MTLTTREATTADAATLADFHVAAWRETYGRLLPEGLTPLITDARMVR